MIKRFTPHLQCAFSHIQPNLPLAASNHFSTEQSCSDYINSLCKSNLHKEALSAFDFLLKNSSFRLKPSTYTHLIFACTCLKSLEHGKRIHNHILKSNFQPDMILQNHILNMYGKCGSWRDARNVFDEMAQRNVVSWTSLISGCSQNDQEDYAIRLYFQMLQSGYVPDHFTFGSIIKACSGLDNVMLGRQLHGHVIKSEFGSHKIAQNALISMYTNFGQISDASVIFSRISEKDLISWGSIIAGFSQLGYELEALLQFKKMIHQGVHQPNEFIFGSTFSACSTLLQPHLGRLVHGMCIKYGLGKNHFAGCSLCDMYAKSGLLDSARTVFYQIERPDLVSWNAIIAGFASNGDANEAISLFCKMRHDGLVPNDVTVLSLLCAHTKPTMLHQGMQVHSYIMKMGFDLEIPVCNSLITMYAKCSNLDDVFNVFEGMKNKSDLVSWNAALTACMHQDHAGEVFVLLKRMLISNLKPDYVTLTNALGACGEIASLKAGSQVHCFCVKSGLILDVSVVNGLINMYMKCGSVGSARKLFDSMDNPDVISWSSLIVGYAQSGCGEETLKLFETMRSQGVKPNQITYVGVLTACSHIGLVEEGQKLYRTMETEHGVSPTREHCSCIVDLLARSGRLDEAENFIKQMGFNPDVVVWKTLLAACKPYGNIEIAKRAAENILKIDPFNSACYILLCNIHASSGSWRDVARMRSLMKQKDVHKIPGQSWIEVKDRVHVFLAEDSLHPERGEIYSILEELWLQMLDDDYCSLRGDF